METDTFCSNITHLNKIVNEIFVSSVSKEPTEVRIVRSESFIFDISRRCWRYFSLTAFSCARINCSRVSPSEYGCFLPLTSSSNVCARYEHASSRRLNSRSTTSSFALGTWEDEKQRTNSIIEHREEEKTEKQNMAMNSFFHPKVSSTILNQVNWFYKWVRQLLEEGKISPRKSKKTREYNSFIPLCENIRTWDIYVSLGQDRDWFEFVRQKLDFHLEGKKKLALNQSKDDEECSNLIQWRPLHRDLQYNHSYEM